MKRAWKAALLIPLLAACDNNIPPETDAGSTHWVGSVESFDPRFDAIVSTDARLEVLAEGHKWTEGPLWVPVLESLLYSDIPNNAIYRWREGEGASLWLQPAGDTTAIDAGGQGGSNGLALDEAGRLVLTQHGDRRVVRLTASLDAPAAEFETLVAMADGRRLNSPNDLVMHSSGDIYFTDPPYGLAQGNENPAKEIELNGVYRLAADGRLELLIPDITMPNGIALSPDETVLYVSNSDRDRPAIMAYDVNADGGVGPGSLLYESWGDGMAVDQDGNVYVAGPEEGVVVIAPDGQMLGAMKTGQPTSNCSFGDDGSTLYITSNSRLLRIRTSAVGVGF